VHSDFLLEVGKSKTTSLYEIKVWSRATQSLDLDILAIWVS